MEYLEIISLNGVLAGFVTAILVALTGVGGGAVMTPMLTLWLKLPLATAIGTDLIYVVITKISAVFLHSKAGRVDWKVVRKILMGSLPAATIVILILTQVKNFDGLSGYLSIILGIILGITAIAMLYRTYSPKVRDRRVEIDNPQPPTIHFVGVGILLGLLVALTSIGAGAIGILLLLQLMPFAKMNRIVGTDIAQALPLALVAGIGHMSMGNVNWTILVSLLLGMLPGVLIGNKLSGVIPDKLLRTILSLILLTISVVFLVKAFA